MNSLSKTETMSSSRLYAAFDTIQRDRYVEQLKASDAPSVKDNKYFIVATN